MQNCKTDVSSFGKQSLECKPIGSKWLNEIKLNVWLESWPYFIDNYWRSLKIPCKTLLFVPNIVMSQIDQVF